MTSGRRKLAQGGAGVHDAGTAQASSGGATDGLHRLFRRSEQRTARKVREAAGAGGTRRARSGGDRSERCRERQDQAAAGEDGAGSGQIGRRWELWCSHGGDWEGGRLGMTCGAHLHRERKK
jgi:hypothetical protein